MDEFAVLLQYSLPTIIMAVIVMTLVGVVKVFIKPKHQSAWFSRLYFALVLVFAFAVAAAYYAWHLQMPAFVGFVFYRDIASVVGLTQILYPLYRKCGGRKLFLAVIKLFKGQNADLDKLIGEIEKLLKDNVVMTDEQQEVVHKGLQQLKEKA